MAIIHRCEEQDAEQTLAAVCSEALGLRSDLGERDSCFRVASEVIDRFEEKTEATCSTSIFVQTLMVQAALPHPDEGGSIIGVIPETACRGHLQATGRDAAGRKRHRYHPDWVARRGRTQVRRARGLRPGAAALARAHRSGSWLPPAHAALRWRRSWPCSTGPRGGWTVPATRSRTASSEPVPCLATTSTSRRRTSPPLPSPASEARE